MIDVRNSIAKILDRYNLAQVVEVTLSKMRRDGVSPPFAVGAVKDKPDAIRHNARAADGFLAGLSGLAEAFFPEI